MNLNLSYLYFSPTREAERSEIELPPYQCVPLTQPDRATGFEPVRRVASSCGMIADMEQRLDVGTCRKLLGGETSTLTEDQLRVITDEVYELAAIVAESYTDFVKASESFDLESLNPPGIEAIFAKMGWDISGEE